MRTFSVSVRFLSTSIPLRSAALKCPIPAEKDRHAVVKEKTTTRQRQGIRATRPSSPLRSPAAPHRTCRRTTAGQATPPPGPDQTTHLLTLLSAIFLAACASCSSRRSTSSRLAASLLPLQTNNIIHLLRFPSESIYNVLSPNSNNNNNKNNGIFF